FAEPTDDTDRYFVIGDSALSSKPPANFRELIQVQTQRHYAKLLVPTNAERPGNFMALLFADDDYSIGASPGQQALDQNKQPCLQRTVITVKDMPVIGVYDAALTRPQQKSRWREPLVDHS